MTNRSKAVIAILISVIWVLIVTVFSWGVASIKLWHPAPFDIEVFFKGL
jgi:hypothetical protein